MARKRRRRRGAPAGGDPQIGDPGAAEHTAKPPSAVARISYPDEDTMRLRTFWSPLPPSFYGAVPGLIAAIIAIAVWEPSLSAAIIAGAIGYFAGGIAWALLGAVGGDLLEIEFDLAEDVGRVRQSMLWAYRREWQFELYDVREIIVNERRGRALLLQFGSTFTAQLLFQNEDTLRFGRFHTEREVDAVSDSVGDFLGVPLRRDGA